MIKINLVPVKEKKKRQEFLALFGVVLFFIAFVAALLVFYAKRRAVANDLKNQITEVQKQIDSHDKESKEVDAFNAQKASLDAVKKTISGITETQRKVLVGMDESALNMPDGVWLTRIEQGKGNDGSKFVLQGYAVSPDKMQEYLSNLQKPGNLLKDASIEVKSASVTLQSNPSVHLPQFEVHFTVADAGS